MDVVVYIRWGNLYLHGFTDSGSTLWTADMNDAIFLCPARANKLILSIPLVEEQIKDLEIGEYV